MLLKNSNQSNPHTLRQTFCEVGVGDRPPLDMLSRSTVTLVKSCGGASSSKLKRPDGAFHLTVH